MNSSKSYQSVLANKVNNELELLVVGYVRLQIEEQDLLQEVIPDAIKLLLAKFYGLGFVYSSILSFDEMAMLSTLLSSRLAINSTFCLRLLYRSSRDGCKAFAFHERCDNIANTVTIIQSKDFDHVFGGFTAVPWGRSNKDVRRSIAGAEKEDTFLFILRSKDTQVQAMLPHLIELKKGKRKITLVQHCASLGPCFGFEDVRIGSNMSDAHTYYNGAFHLLKGITQSDANIHPLSGRSHDGFILSGYVDHFQAIKIEVFGLVFAD